MDKVKLVTWVAIMALGIALWYFIFKLITNILN